MFAPSARLIAFLVITAPVVVSGATVRHVVRKGTVGDPFVPIELAGHQF